MNKFLSIAFSLLLVFTFSACGNSKKTNPKPTAGKPTPSSELVFKKTFHSAMRLKMTGRYKEAEEEFEKCLALEPKNDGVNFALSELSAYKNDIESAIEFGEKARELQPKNKWYMLNLALLYQQKGDYTKASEAYESVLKDENSDINYWYAYSEALIYNKNYTKAIEAYDKIESKLGVVPEISIRKQNLYMELGKLDKAEAELKKMIATSPKNPQFHGALSDFYIRNGQDAKAKSVLDKMIELDPNNGMTHLSLADYYSKQGNLTQIKHHLHEAFKADDMELDMKIGILIDNFNRIGKPGDLGKEFSYKLLNTLASKYSDEAKVFAVYGDYDKAYHNIRNARDMYLKSIQRDNSKYPIWSEMLMLSANLADYDTLFIKGKQAIELFPSQPMLYLLTGMGAYEENNTDEAIEILTTGKNYLIDEKEMKAEFEFQLGQAYIRNKDYDNAFRYYEKAVQIDSFSTIYLNNYAYNLAQQKKDLNKALRLAKRATNLKPGSATYEDTYGWVLFQMGRYEEAKNWLKSALDNEPTMADYNEHYGDVLFKLGKKIEAQGFWSKARGLGKKSAILDKKIEEGAYFE